MEPPIKIFVRTDYVMLQNDINKYLNDNFDSVDIASYNVEFHYEMSDSRYSCMIVDRRENGYE